MTDPEAWLLVNLALVIVRVPPMAKNCATVLSLVADELGAGDRQGAAAGIYCATVVSLVVGELGAGDR